MPRARDSSRPIYPVGKYPRPTSTKIAGVVISRREKELLGLQGVGITTESAQAAEMKLKPLTVNNYWSELFHKLRSAGLEVHSKEEAVAWARSARSIPQDAGAHQRDANFRTKRKAGTRNIR